ncbi:MAG: DUF6760 family protein [Anaerolineae bacterium]
MSYPLDRLHKEVAFIAKTLSWGHDELVNMTHSERRRWVQQIQALQQRARQRPREG